MLCGAATLVLTGDPLSGLVICLALWFLISLVLSMLALNIIDTRLWSIVSFPVKRIGPWPIRWPLYVAAVVLAVFLGAPQFLITLLVAPVLVYDVVRHMKAGRHVSRPGLVRPAPGARQLVGRIPSGRAADLAPVGWARRAARGRD
jgi:hypothetical protein